MSIDVSNEELSFLIHNLDRVASGSPNAEILTKRQLTALILLLSIEVVA